VMLSPLLPRGVQHEVFPPGGVYFFFRPLSNWHTFDVAVQNLSMVGDPDQGDRSGNDSIYFKTVDGNDIAVDVTIAWTVDPQAAPYLLQFVGSDTDEIENKLVRPVARTVVRDVLNRLSSEEYYVAARRYKMAAIARDRLNQVLEPEGVLINEVLLGEHQFNKTYEQTIRDKKVAEQEAERVKSEQAAAEEELRGDMEKVKGQISRAFAEADGKAKKHRLQGDAIYYEKKRESEAIRIEGRAHADALIERAKAMQGAGGRNMVKLKVAEQLRGKKIIFVPAGSGMDFRTMDMNSFLQTYGTAALAKE
jgi:regulator of protease activity HflC (stomatin/prohibitin superfamily)